MLSAPWACEFKRAGCTRLSKYAMSPPMEFPDEPAPGELNRSGVRLPGGGWITAVGPVHFVRRATTSASMERSANAMFGWDLS